MKPAPAEGWAGSKWDRSGTSHWNRERFEGFRRALEIVRDARRTAMCDKFYSLDPREAFDENARALDEEGGPGGGRAR